MKKVLRNIDKPLLIASFILLAIGLIMVFSSSNVTAYMLREASPYNYFIKQAFFLIAGLIISFIILTKFNTKFYGMVSWVGIVIIIPILIVLLIVGQAQNQAVSWFDIGPISIQPSEFAKVIMILFMARYYEVNRDKLDKYTTSLFPLLIAVVIFFLILIQPDLGTGIIFAVIVGTLFLLAPLKGKIKGQVCIAGSVCIAFAALIIMNSDASSTNLIHDRQLDRLNFTDPCSRLLSTGDQVCNGYIAINNGGLFGVGLGNSTQKYLYLSEPYTDFIFAIIVEELGCVIGALIICLEAFVIFRIIKIGRNSYTNRGALMCYGVATYIFTHIVVNLGGLLGLIPLTGVPLPFMSYGGSYTLCLMVSLAIVERVAAETGIRNELKSNPPKQKKLKRG